MKLWMVALVVLVPVQQADEALKKETAYNSLQRFALPRLPFGAHCDVTESAGSPVCFLSWKVDLDDATCAPLKAAPHTRFMGSSDSVGAGGRCRECPWAHPRGAEDPGQRNGAGQRL